MKPQVQLMSKHERSSGFCPFRPTNSALSFPVLRYLGGSNGLVRLAARMAAKSSRRHR